ncbi:non-ribosomal peptide synthetase [Chitinophaga nivalis]|uniref:AMP-binding protein n=1 Tax=Chitinophaga nivalis TaxID=2991709 RepID=A0ABT3IK99_9BACT|nr:non-ribosomal peptide synthetase [Chitinophaga nivalis]MCW3465924.1 AMP-binding protein [Chitinophaga nivalis]MCW3484385.1 AMP-binding protein [Chitinophaga nivalis]
MENEILTLIRNLKESNVDLTLVGNDLEINYDGTLSEILYDRIKARKSEIVGFLKAIQEEAGTRETTGIMEQLTPFQKGIVSYVKNNPDSNRYILQFTFRFDETLPFTFFHQICSILVSRHEILRTIYDFDDSQGMFTAQVLPADCLVCNKIEAGTAAEITRQLEQLSTRKFDISTRPLIRFHLLETPTGSIAVINIHHLIMDGNTVSLLLEELWQIGEDLKAGRPVPVSLADNRQFSTYVKWMNNLDRKKSVAYWKQQLSNCSPALPESCSVGEVPAAQQVYRELKQEYTLDAASLRLLKAEGLSLSAAFNFFTGQALAACFGYQEFIWGNMVTLRPSELHGIENVMGPCIATIPVRMNFGTDKPVTDMIRELQAQVLVSRENANLSLSEIFNAGGSHNLFSVLFSYQHFSKTNQPATGQEINISDAGRSVTSHFPLTVMVYERDTAVNLIVSYRADLFTGWVLQSVMHTVAGNFNQLTSLAEQSVSALDIFTAPAAISPAVLRGEVVPAGAYPVSLTDWFMQAVERYPQQIAVRDHDGKEVTYAALDQMSNYIAARLISHQISGAVGIHLHRSVKAIAGVIGTLKAGCHVTSLEKDFPEEKLLWLHAAIGIKAVIADEQAVLLQALPADILQIPLGVEVPLYDTAITFPVITADMVCAVNYTSGSTGEPKMVLTSHGSHLNRLQWLYTQFPAEGHDVYCQKTLLSFAPAIREIFEPLVQGATLYLFPEAATKDLELFEQTLANSAITRIFLTPTFLQLLADNHKISCLSGLSILEISGEPVKVTLLEKIRGQLPAVRLLNRYGATEAASVVYYEYTNADNSPSSFVQLGTPIANTRVYVMDESLKPRPVGVVGEIVLAGDSLASGYRDEVPEAGVFIRGVAEKEPVLLKTGDLGYIDNTGKLCYQGRKNRMIKIRGFRIEPGEIEFNLMQHTSVEQSAVIPLNTNGGQRIIAFCVPAEKEVQLNNIAIRAFLQERMPSYMLPHEIRKIDSIPVTASGKVDYRRLESMVATDVSRNTANAPVTPTERAIYDIVKLLLPEIQLDAQTDFFELGLDSILVMRATYEIRKQFDVKIAGSDIYSCNNIQKLAGLIDKVRRSGDQGIGYYTLNFKAANEHVIFLIPPIVTNSLIYHGLGPFVPEGLSVVVFDPFDVEKYKAQSDTLEEMAAVYVNSILNIGKEKVIHLAGWSFGASVTYEAAVQVQKSGVEVRSLILIDPGFNTSDYDDDISREKLVNILNQLLIQGGIDPKAESGVAETFTELMYKANFLIKQYRPGDFEGEINLVKPASVSSFERNFDKPFNGIEKFSGSKVQVSTITGNHMTMMFKPFEEIAGIFFGNIRYDKR